MDFVEQVGGDLLNIAMQCGVALLFVVAAAFFAAVTGNINNSLGKFCTASGSIGNPPINNRS
ncbi:hypothetical protein NYF23_12170 [SAR92 clade bacterium H455]|uniref:Flp family type IVb pilin n=1 Tax=SAR92 clade bacterium H455 TaxID=2974818 RepID=A0ABY5TN25_9GAMM|nr:hypothetical protein NYF23_12170 [SAR92 clade bacterium H455]